LAIGQDPKDLPVAFVVGEAGYTGCRSNASLERRCPISMESFVPHPNEFMDDLSCRYLSFVDNSTINLGRK